jgi:hypothetical protein
VAYSHVQLDTARTIIAVGKSVGASRKQIKAALMTALGESTLNPTAVNRKSGATGWRQELKSSYPNVDRTDAAGQARRFYRETAGRGGSAASIAEAVQRAGVGQGYLLAHSGEAGALMRRLGAGAGGSGRTPGMSTGVPHVTQYGVKRGLPHTDIDQALIDALVSGRKNPVTSALHAVDSGAYTTEGQDRLIRKRQNAADAGGLLLAPGGAKGSVNKAPGADRAGVATKPVVLSFVSKIAGIFGQSLTIGTGTRHSRMTVDGNVSDHWSGNAADIPATGRRLIRLGQAALIAAGMDPSEARRKTGGLFNVGGHQIIFNTHLGGDHTNHLHVSAH